MTTALLLLALLGTAWGQPTYYVPDTTSIIFHAIPGIDESVTVPPSLPDSLCATCGDTCRVVQVPCPDSTFLKNNLQFGCSTLHYGRRCPQHGRHIRWMNEKRQDGWGTHFIFADTLTVELGLREDGAVTWRRKENNP
jgi:hypothetical protein